MATCAPPSDLVRNLAEFGCQRCGNGAMDALHKFFVHCDAHVFNAGRYDRNRVRGPQIGFIWVCEACESVLSSTCIECGGVDESIKAKLLHFCDECLEGKKAVDDVVPATVPETPPVVKVEKWCLRCLRACLDYSSCPCGDTPSGPPSTPYSVIKKVQRPILKLPKGCCICESLIETVTPPATPVKRRSGVARIVSDSFVKRSRRVRQICIEIGEPTGATPPASPDESIEREDGDYEP
jgi:hypothetical protein